MKPRKAVERAGGEGTPVQEELLGACCLKASQLLQVLEEESVVLKTFQTDLLLAILPRKESLTLELGKIVEDLARLKAETGKVDHDPSFARFGERLKEIRKRNRWNQAFLKDLSSISRISSSASFPLPIRLVGTKPPGLFQLPSRGWP